MLCSALRVSMAAYYSLCQIVAVCFAAKPYPRLQNIFSFLQASLQLSRRYWISGAQLSPATCDLRPATSCRGKIVARLERPVSCRGERMKDEAQTTIRILVVDDEEVLVDLIGTGLRYEGFEVAVASDGASALAQAAAF